MSIGFPKAEEDILALWREIDAFKTQLQLTEGCESFTFYDGPPFGMAHVPFPYSLSPVELLSRKYF